MVSRVTWRRTLQQKPYPLKSQKKRLTYCFPFSGQASRAAFQSKAPHNRTRSATGTPKAWPFPSQAMAPNTRNNCAPLSGNDPSHPLYLGIGGAPSLFWSIFCYWGKHTSGKHEAVLCDKQGRLQRAGFQCLVLCATRSLA